MLQHPTSSNRSTRRRMPKAAKRRAKEKPPGQRWDKIVDLEAAEGPGV